jgi:hypothetical protein
MKTAVFKKLENGKWSIAIPSGYLTADPFLLGKNPFDCFGKIVTVSKRDGTNARVVLGSFLGFKYNNGIFEIQSSKPARLFKQNSDWFVFVPHGVQVLTRKDGKKGVYATKKDSSVDFFILAHLVKETKNGKVYEVSSDQGFIFDE